MASSFDPTTIEGTRNAGGIQGNLFQLKLSMLFLIRGIGEQHDFCLGTEIEKLGGKFDDVIYAYKMSHETKDKRRFRCLQAKHKLDENLKIKGDELVRNENENFSLPKYFQSYKKTTTEYKSMCSFEDFIICTNIGFEDQSNLASLGIELERKVEIEDILTFNQSVDGKSPMRYKLKATEQLTNILKGARHLAEYLNDCAMTNKSLDANTEMFKAYYSSLIEENVLINDQAGTKFTKQFIKDRELSPGAVFLRKTLTDMYPAWKQWNFRLRPTFRKTSSGKKPPKLPNFSGTDEEILGFLNKLVFVIETPNEVELDTILKSELKTYFQLNQTDAQYNCLLKKLLDWFKKKKNKAKDSWTTSGEAREMLKEISYKTELSYIKALSNEYEKKVQTFIAFNDDASKEMARKLKDFLDGSCNRQVLYVTTLSPKFTASKVFSALKTISQFKSNGSFLATSSRNLQKEIDKERWESAFFTLGHCQLLIVVCEENGTQTTKNLIENLIINENSSLLLDEKPSLPKKRKFDFQKKVIIICKKAKHADTERAVKTNNNLDMPIIRDSIIYDHLDDIAKIKLQTTIVSFQGEKLKIDELLENEETNKVLNLDSITELLSKEEVIIPSFEDIRFEEPYYIKRNIRYPTFDNQFWENLAKKLDCTLEHLRAECQTDARGKIHWLTNNSERITNIWDNMKRVRKELKESFRNISEDDLIFKETQQGEVIIISGVAGTGKSTILSYFYGQIKRIKASHHFVLRINLNDQENNLFQLNTANIDKQKAIEFLIEHSVGELGDKCISSFTRSLIQHYLETSGKMSILIDGFDEIDTNEQKKVIKLIKVLISKTQIDTIYLASRSHTIEALQREIKRFPFTLENFSKESQIKCLTDYWRKQLAGTLHHYDETMLVKCAQSLIGALTNSLDDKERTFIGIPLQCRIAAESFQSEIEKLMEQKCMDALFIQNIDGAELNVASLYERLMNTKRDIYCNEKLKTENLIGKKKSLIYKQVSQLEKFLEELSIRTIVGNQKDIDLLLCQTGDRHPKCKPDDIEDGISYGLLKRNEINNKPLFLHRTYAEYLVAEYINKGFVSEDDSKHKPYFDSGDVVQFLVTKVFRKKRFEGVRVFLNCMVKKIIEDEAWQRAVKQRGITDNLTKGLVSFTKHLATNVKCDTSMRALHDATENTNIFIFLCDCLDMTLASSEIRYILHSAFFGDCLIMWSPILEKNDRMFERCLRCYDDANDRQVKTILSVILYEALEFNTLYNCEEERSVKITKRVIQFAIERSDQVLRGMDSKELYTRNLKTLKFLLSSKTTGYWVLLQDFLEFLSLLYACNEDHALLNLLWLSLVHVFYSSRLHIPVILEEIFRILEECKRMDIICALRPKILALDKETFGALYGINHTREAIDNSVISLTERNEWRMTFLHRAVFLNDFDGVQATLEKIDNALSNSAILEEEKKAAIQVIQHMLFDKCGFTPLYVAVACSHKEICFAVFDFVRKHIPQGLLEKSVDHRFGFLYNAVRDAIQIKNYEMFQTVLQSVKHIVGQNGFIRLIHTKHNKVSSLTLFEKCDDRKLINIIAKNLIHQEIEGIVILNKIIFQYKVINRFKLIETELLHKMIAAIGPRRWLEHLLNTNAGFDLLISDIFHKLENSQQQLAVQMITSVNDNTRYDYFKKQFGEELRKANKFGGAMSNLVNFFTFLKENAGHDIVSELICRNKDVVIDEALHEAKTFDIVLQNVGESKQGELVDYLLHYAVTHIEGFFQQSREGYNHYWISLLEFTINFITADHITAFLNVISNSSIIWSTYFERSPNCDPKEQSKKISVFFKRIIEKSGEDDVVNLIRKDQVMLKAISRYDEQLFDAMLHHLSKDKQDDLRKQLVEELPHYIQHHIAESDWGCDSMNMVKYLESHSDPEQLQQFIKSILTVPENSTKLTEWESETTAADDVDRNVPKIKRFLKLVGDKIGKDEVKKLVLFRGREGVVIVCAARYGADSLVQVMLDELDDNDREEARVMIDSVEERYEDSSEEEN